MGESGTRADGPDLEFFEKHFTPWDPRYPAGIEEALPTLHQECPVAHSDALGGFWMTFAYKDFVDVFQNWQAFSSTMGPQLVSEDSEPLPDMPPISTDPPVQRDYRQMLNPYLTPNRVAAYEPGVRQLVTELIDGFIERGECDLAGEMAREFPGRMLFGLMMGADPAEVPKLQKLTKSIGYQLGDVAESQRQYAEWILGYIERRRKEPRRDDIIDGILNGTVEGKLLTDEQAVGVISILILGGFETTSEALSNTVYRLTLDLDLQDRLRNDPSFIPYAIDEFLRFDPPVEILPRICTKDTEVGGQLVRKGERIGVSFLGANRDPAEFPDPDRLNVDRAPNRHLTFGIGVHRCIGSNTARLNLRVSLEEILSRLGEFRLAEGFTGPVRGLGGTWGMESLPITFTPGPRLGKAS